MRSQATTDMIYYKDFEIYIFVFPISLMMTFWKSKHVAGDNVSLTKKKIVFEGVLVIICYTEEFKSGHYNLFL